MTGLESIGWMIWMCQMKLSNNTGKGDVRLGKRRLYTLPSMNVVIKDESVSSSPRPTERHAGGAVHGNVVSEISGHGVVMEYLMHTGWHWLLAQRQGNEQHRSSCLLYISKLTSRGCQLESSAYLSVDEWMRSLRDVGSFVRHACSKGAYAASRSEIRCVLGSGDRWKTCDDQLAQLRYPDMA